MSAFIGGVRGAFLYLSRQQNLRKWLETSPEARKLTSRFIAGLHLDDALRVAGDLQRTGVQSSLDYLGENVATEAEAQAAFNEYVSALSSIASSGLPATVSVKLTALGLDISGELCRANARALVQAAAASGNRIEFDMEDSRYTERTLNIVHEMNAQHAGHVRAVIQAYLYRSEADVDELCRLRIPVRLCKGAYNENTSVAWPDKQDVDRSFVRLMRTLFERGTHPAIATHDDNVVGQAIALVRAHGIQPGQFEFQMLYGVRRKLQQSVLNRDFRLRLYLPYGTAWYPYFMRRLAERPANVLFLARSIAKG